MPPKLPLPSAAVPARLVPTSFPSIRLPVPETMVMPSKRLAETRLLAPVPVRPPIVLLDPITAIPY